MVRRKVMGAVELTDNELELATGGRWGFGGGRGRSRGGAIAINGPLGTGGAAAWRASSAVGFGAGGGPGGGLGFRVCLRHCQCLGLQWSARQRCRQQWHLRRRRIWPRPTVTAVCVP